MYIFIMRHGDAVTAVHNHNDRDRILSDKGIHQSVQSAKWLEKFISDLAIKIDFSLISPYVRAQQTFTNMKNEITLDSSLTADSFDTEDITPFGDVLTARRNLDAFLSQHDDTQALLLVSHLPFVSYLLDELCTIQHSMIFDTGAIACVDYDIGQSVGKLITVYTPDE